MGLRRNTIMFFDSALRTVISQYTREAGLRNLGGKSLRYCRKVARRIAEGRREFAGSLQKVFEGI